MALLSRLLKTCSIRSGSHTAWTASTGSSTASGWIASVGWKRVVAFRTTSRKSQFSTRSSRAPARMRSASSRSKTIRSSRSTIFRDPVQNCLHLLARLMVAGGRDGQLQRAQRIPHVVGHARQECRPAQRLLGQRRGHGIEVSSDRPELVRPRDDRPGPLVTGGVAPHAVGDRQGRLEQPSTGHGQDGSSASMARMAARPIQLPDRSQLAASSREARA